MVISFTAQIYDIACAKLIKVTPTRLPAHNNNICILTACMYCPYYTELRKLPVNVIFAVSPPAELLTWHVYSPPSTWSSLSMLDVSSLISIPLKNHRKLLLGPPLALQFRVAGSLAENSTLEFSASTSTLPSGETAQQR